MANGLAVMRDEETKSLWDHITGECFEGPLEGERLPFWPVYLTTVEAELHSHPDVLLLRSGYRSIKTGVMNMILKSRTGLHTEGTTLLPQFRNTMNGKIDPRLPEGEQGLGLMTEDHQARFYPVRLIPKGGCIMDTWQGKKVQIERSAIDGVPVATYVDSDEVPMQLLSRWYGFAFTYPDCEIYGA